MTLPTQFVTLATTILNGVLFGASFDTYNFFLKRQTRKAWFVFTMDVLFWCCQAILAFFILFQVNYGEIRFYLFLALLCGFSAYQALLRTWYLHWLTWIIHIVVESFLFFKKLTHHLLIRPIQWVIILITSILLFISRLLTKFVKMLLQIAKFLLKRVLFLVTLLFRPVFWLFTKLWQILPSRFTSIITHFLLKWKQMGQALARKVSERWKKWISKR